jgi:hypothetical protein
MVNTLTASNHGTDLARLSPDLLKVAVSFLHGTHYRSVATSCNLLLDAYTHQTETSADTSSGESNKKTTSMRVVVSSVSYTKVFAKDHHYVADVGRDLFTLAWEERETSALFWRSAARHSNLETLTYVLRLSSPIFARGEKKAIIWAMEGNQSFEVVCLLMEYFRFCPQTLGAAARLGRLDCLKNLRREPSSYDNNGCLACTMAARYGNYAILVWAREAGCGWSEDTHFWAMRGDDEQIKKYVNTMDCPRYSDEDTRRKNARNLTTPTYYERLRRRGGTRSYY